MLGQTLTGDFTLRQVTTGPGPDGIPGNADDPQAVEIMIANASLGLGDGSQNFLTLSHGSGDLLVFDTTGQTGIAGVIGATVSLNGIQNVSLAGNLNLQLNTTGRQVTAVYQDPGLPTPTSLTLPAGTTPYLQVAGTGVTLTVGGQTLTGDFTFTRGNGSMTITLANVSLGLGDGTTNFVSVTNGSGSLSLSAANGTSGSFAGNVAIDVPGVSFNGTLSVNFATTAGNTAISITGSNVSLSIAGETISATSVLITVQTAAIAGTPPTSETAVEVAFTGLSLQFGSYVNIPPAAGLSGAMLIDHNGVAAAFSAATTGSVFSIPGAGFGPATGTTMSLSLRINTGAQPVNETIGGQTINVPAGPYLQVIVSNALLTIGAATLSGSFAFDQSTEAGFAAPATQSTVDGTAIAVVDVNGDGYPDIVLGLAGGGTELYLNKGKDSSGNWAGFGTGTVIGTGTAATTAVALADVNHDGLPDLIFSTGGSGGQTSIYLNLGRPTTTLTQALLSGATTVHVSSTAGFASSGTLLVGGETVTYTGLGSDGQSFTGVTVTGTSTQVLGAGVTPAAWQGFATVATVLSTPYSTSIATGDVNGDGFLDVVVGASNSTASDQLFLNSGKASSATGNVATTTWGFAAGTAIGSAGAVTTSVALGDVNGDHVADLMVGNSSGGDQLYLNNGLQAGAWQGFATSPIALGTGTAPDTTAVALADVNGDGYLDVVAANTGTTSDIYLNNGSTGSTWNQFNTTPTTLTTGAGATSIATGDVNGDGAVDLVLGETGAAPQLFVNRGQDATGKGWLGLKDGVAIGTTAKSPGGVVLANVDTNSALDLLLVQSAAATVLYPGTSVPVTRIGLTGVTASLTPTGSSNGLTVDNGQGAFIIEPGGVAGTFSGTIDATAGGFNAHASASVGFNSSTSAIDDTVVVNGVTIPVVFTSPGQIAKNGQPYISVSGSGVLSLGGFVEIEGQNFSWNNQTMQPAVGTLIVFLGQGPAFLSDGTLNPTARGVFLTIDHYESVQASGGYAFEATGTLTVVGLSGITVSGTVTVEFNSTGQSEFGIAAGTPSAPTVNFSGLPVMVSVEGLSLTGDIGFAYDGTSFTVQFGSSALPNGTTASSADDVVLGLGPSTGTAPNLQYPVLVTIPSGSLTLSSAGVFGEFAATAALNVPGFSSSVTGQVQVNTTSASQTASGDPLLPNSFALQVTIPVNAATGQGLTILGQSLSGSFSFSQQTLPVSPTAAPGTKPSVLVQIAATNVSLTLGTSSAGVSLTGGTGMLLLTSGGLAGQLSGTPTFLGLPSGTSFGGTFVVQINTTTSAVAQQFQVGGTSTSLTLPAGPYFRIEGDNAQLSIAGQSVSGNFAFESAAGSGNSQIVRVAVSNVSVSLGDGSQSLVTLSGGSGLLIFNSSGVAGQLSGNVTVSIPGVTLVGSLVLQLNTTGAPITESMTFGPQPSQTTAVAVGDVNGDGRPDLIVATATGQKLLYLNDGQADPFNSLTPIQIGPSGSTTDQTSSSDKTTALVLADVNADGALDLLVVNNGSANEVYLGDGKGDFSLSSASLGGASGIDDTSIAVGDVNGDGKLDVVIGASGAAPELYVNQGNNSSGNWQGFATATAIGTGSPTTTAVALADVNNSGTLDLIVGNASGGNQLYLNTTTGHVASFALDSSSGLRSGATSAIAVGDVNGDGMPDVVFAINGGPSQVYLNTGHATTWAGFTTGATLGSGTPATTSVAIGDVNGDGHRDIVLGTSNGAAELFLGDGTGAFTAAPSAGFPVPAAPDTRAVVLADLNGDGHLDLLLGESGGAPDLLLGSGTGTFADPVSVGAASLSLQGDTTLSVQGSGLTLSLLGQTLTGNFAFSEGASNGRRVVTLSVTGGQLALGGFGTVSVSGSLLLTDGGIAGELTMSGSPLSIGPVTLSGGLQVEVNTIAMPELLPDGTTRLPTGPYMQIASVPGQSITIDLGNGVTLTGSFTIQQTTDSSGQSQVALAGSGISASLGAALANLLTGGQGLLVILPTGLAGQLQGTINAGSLIPGASFAGTFGLAINQTAAAVSESLPVGGQTLSIDLPAGPYVELSATSIALTVLGQTLTGNFAFQHTASADTLTASNVSLGLGNGTTNFVTLTNGQGSFTVTGAGDTSGAAADGLVGTLSGKLAVNITGVSVSGTFALSIDTTGGATKLEIDGGTPGAPVNLTVLGQTLSGVFTFTQAAGATQLTISSASAFIGSPGVAGLNITQGSGSLTISSAGLTGNLSATVGFVGLPAGVQFGGGNALPIAVQFAPRSLLAQLGNSTTPASLSVLGQTISGIFSFQRATDAGPDGVLNTTDDRTVVKAGRHRRQPVPRR